MVKIIREKKRNLIAEAKALSQRNIQERKFEAGVKKEAVKLKLELLKTRGQIEKDILKGETGKIKQQEKLERAGLATKKFETKEKEKKAKKWQKVSKKIDKALRKRLVHRPILKKERPTLTIRQKEIPSVLGDYNRFFKSEMQKEFEL